MSTIAIVGQGFMGRTHAQAWSQIGRGDDIAYVCTPRPGAPLEHAPKARFVTDFAEVLNDPEVEYISICSPTATHRDLTVAALEAGKNVLLEKPVALRLEDALAIHEAAKSASGTLMVAHVIRFFPGYLKLRDEVAAGTLGELRSVRAVRKSNRPNWAEWWHDEEQSGGVPVDFSIHDFDQTNMYLGRPVAVRAVSRGQYGPLEAVVEYADGGIASVLGYADTAQGVPFASSIDVYGSDGDASYRFSAGSPTEGGSGASVYSRDGIHGSIEETVEGEDGYTAQTRYFVSCVESGTAPLRVTTGAAIRALEVSLATRRSIKEGGARIEIDSAIDDEDAAGTALQA